MGDQFEVKERPVSGSSSIGDAKSTEKDYRDFVYSAAEELGDMDSFPKDGIETSSTPARPLAPHSFHADVVVVAESD